MVCNLLLALAALVLTSAGAIGTARAATWQVRLAGEAGTPGGYVQVRENAILGTPLGLRSTLGVSTIHTLRLSTIRSLGPAGALHLALGSTELTGSSVLYQRVYFNGVTIAPGPIFSNTRFQDFCRLQAAYWRRVWSFAGSVGLWLSAGLSFVSLNFRINATIAPDSAGHETKEDFNTPIPLFGIHLRYLLADGLSLFADLSGGICHGPTVCAGKAGMVQLTQTNSDARLGLSYRSSGGLVARLYLFDDRYWQDERSAEDGNYTRIYQHGVGLGIGHRF